MVELCLGNNNNNNSCVIFSVFLLKVQMKQIYLQTNKQTNRSNNRNFMTHKIFPEKNVRKFNADRSKQMKVKWSK